MARDWVAWHQAYDDPNSSLSQRLSAISHMIRETLDASPDGTIKVLSLCAGDGRDISLGARGHRRAVDLHGLLVELDPHLAAKAATHVGSVSTGLTVVNADAGRPAVFREVLPVDLLLLCGIFGNVTSPDIEHTIAAVLVLCRAGATVIWTRHRRKPDMTPSIRAWFNAVGCEATGFVSAGAGRFAIGRERVGVSAHSGPIPDRLFTFRDDLW